MARWSFINSLDGFTTIPFGTINLPGPVSGGSLTVVSSLYVNGISRVPFGDISGWTVMRNPQAFAGDGNNDVLWMGSGSDHVAIIWDERTTGQGGGSGPFFDMYEGWIGDPAGNNIRYGLPGGSIGQETISIETILGGDAHDFINLSYDGGTYNYMIGGVSTPVGPRAYELDITIDVGAGRDLVVSGEGNDVIYGGDENLGLGDGLMGMGGNDTIYGGRNFSSTAGDDLYGYAGNDTLYGANGGEVYYGDSGNDVIYGGGAFSFDPGNPAIPIAPGITDNTFYGGDGDDLMVANATFVNSREFFFGGNPGTDWIDWRFVENPNGLDDSQNDTVSYANWTTAAIHVRLGTGTYGSTGIIMGTGAGAAAQDVFVGIEHIIGSNSVNFGDTIFGSSANNRLEGMAGNDTLDGLGGNDTLFGGDGNDLLISGDGADSMAGGAGIDTLTYATSPGAVTISMSGGTGVGGHAQGDTVAGDIEILIGSAFDDVLTGSAIANTIFGGNGNDTIDGGAGGDSLDGGAGANFISYASSTGAVTVDLGASTATGGFATGDVIANFQHAIGSNGNDTLIGSAGANSLVGGAGVDTIQGGAGGDTMFGGGNGDWLSYAGAAGVLVNLATGAASGSHAAGDVFSGFQHLLGSDGNDTLTGDAQANSIVGGAGVDTIEGGAGGDALFGGGNGDWLSYAGSNAGVSLNLATGAATGGHATGDVFSGFQHLIGSAHGDVLTGNAAANTIFGGAGVDTIEGGAGADSLVGGGEGDWLSYEGSAAGVQVNLGIAAQTSTGDANGDVISGFRHLIGSLHDDVLTGDAQANTILGNDGLDTILGGGGDDVLFGGAGNDTLNGQAGLDTLFGDRGDDVLQLNSDGAVGPGGMIVQGWDGETGSGPVNVAVAAGARLYGDTAYGGIGIDTLDLSGVSNANPGTVYTAANWNTLSPTILAGVEIIIAGSAADIINLTFNDGVTRSAYGENVSIFAGLGNDVVFSGSGNDLLVGGRQNSTGLGGADGGDTIYGGAGNDTIYGDDLTFTVETGGDDLLYGGSGNDTIDGGIGNDTIFGGSGLDLLFGGAGHDLLVDMDGASQIDGGAGADTIVVNYTNAAGDYTVNGGKDEFPDEGDRVFVSGAYNSVQSGLGAGPDLYIASNVDSGTPQIDRVAGESGDDVISTWFGNDTIDGGSGNDALWGGAGSDTIYGGPGSDYLYGGAGNGDVLVGGAGIDYYYWSRTDGNDLIADNDPDRLPGAQGENYIVVFPAGDPNETGPNADWLLDGSGVVETDRDLYDNDGDDMVQLVDLDGAGPGTMYELRILQGAGAGSVLTFDQTEISAIALWNNDATTGTPVITVYAWDEDAGRYLYQG